MTSWAKSGWSGWRSGWMDTPSTAVLKTVRVTQLILECSSHNFHTQDYLLLYISCFPLFAISLKLRFWETVQFFCVSTLTLSTCTIDPKNTDKKHPGYVWDLCTSKRTRFYLFSYSICCICWMVFKWNRGTLSLFLSIFFKGVFGS